MDLPLPSWRAALAAAAALALCWAALGVQRSWRAARLRRRCRRARGLEGLALRLLEAAGYQVIDAQATRRLAVEVDGQPRHYDVRADYLVRDRRGVFVVEVKSGARATDPLHPPTRRQLLEYQLGYSEAAGVLLVDMERERISRVCFPL